MRRSRASRRSRALPAVLTLLVLFGLPRTSAAWGPNGHRVVARIAESHVAPSTARAIEALIGPESLVRVATWADEIRSDPTWDRAAPWHYINIPEGETLDEVDRAPDGDVLSAIERFAGVLRDPEAADADRATALKFLVHFVGDVHQPLHAGYGADRGGNEVLVLWFGDPTDLHAVWDSELVEHQKLSFSEMAELLDHPTPEQVAEWQAASPREWIAESRALLDRVYDLGDRHLGWDYAAAATPIVERRLLQAGVRLAGVLDSVF